MKITLSPDPQQNVIGLFSVIDMKTKARNYKNLPELMRTFHHQQAICHAKGIPGFIFPYQGEVVSITTGTKRAKIVRKSWPLVQEVEEVVNLT